MSRFVTLGLALPLLVSAASAHAVNDGDVSLQRQRELTQLIKHDCGSCHGLTLQGGLGPALTPQALQGKPRELLIATVSEGRPGTPMPPWKPLLSESDIAWLVDHLTGGKMQP